MPPEFKRCIKVANSLAMMLVLATFGNSLSLLLHLDVFLYIPMSPERLPTKPDVKAANRRNTFKRYADKLLSLVP